MRVLSRDPFARTEVERHVAHKKGDCAWCGKKDSKFYYLVIPDSIRVVCRAHDGKVFCSVSCWRSYHS